jgi:DNA polymerase III subunit chi
VLPVLLEKTLERGWRAVVQVGMPEQLDALDDGLWTYRDESFLPHGQARDGHAEFQPVFLTSGDETPNGAGVRFLVEGAVPATYRGFMRLIFMFDGANGHAVASARAQWKAAKAAGCGCAYWQQSEAGRWEKKG